MSSTLYGFYFSSPIITSLAAKMQQSLDIKSGHLHPAFAFFWYKNDDKETLNAFVMPVLQNYLELKQWRAEIN